MFLWRCKDCGWALAGGFGADRCDVCASWADDERARMEEKYGDMDRWAAAAEREDQEARASEEAEVTE